MGVFHWNQPCNQLHDSRVTCKICGLRDENHTKARENAGSVTYPQQDVDCLDQDPDLIWDWDHFLHDKTGDYKDKL